MKIGPRFAHTGKVEYQYGHAYYHYRLIGSSVWKFGRFTHWIDGRVVVSRERVC